MPYDNCGLALRKREGHSD